MSEELMKLWQDMKLFGGFRMNLLIACWIIYYEVAIGVSLSNKEVGIFKWDSIR